MSAPARDGKARLFLVDGSALAYRSFFALGRTPLTTSSGELTGAVLGFANTVWGLIRDHHPEYLAVVFDTKAPTFRHEAYPEYKATRKKMPEELSAQYPRIFEVIETWPLPLLRREGVEADDIMGSYAAQCAGPDLDVVLVSGDKDFCQTVSGHVKMLNPGRGGPSGTGVHWLGPDEVAERFGVPPSAVIDVLALMGDSSDNVPGVPGVGEKTASALIAEYGSLEKLYASLDGLSRKALRAKLEEHRELAFLSKRLVTIKTDVELPASLDELRLRPPSPELVRLFRDLEFGRLAREAEIQSAESRDGATGSAPGRAPVSRGKAGSPASGSAVAGPTSAEAGAPNRPAPGENLNLFDPVEEIAPAAPRSAWTVAVDAAALDRLARTIEESGRVALHVEADDGDPMRAGLLGLGLAPEGSDAVYVPLGHACGGNADLGMVRERLGPLLSGGAVAITGHDLKAGLVTLDRHGLKVTAPSFDTCIASYLLDSERSHDLGRLSQSELGTSPAARTDLLGKGARKRAPADLTAAEGAALAAGGAAAARDLAGPFRSELATRNLEELFSGVEMPLLQVLRLMEETGVVLDTAFLGDMSERMGRSIAGFEQRAHEAAGEPFNLNSPPQLAKILFEKLGLRKARRTKTGYSTDSDVLEELAGDHPLPGIVLEYRQIMKLKSTYVDALPRLVHPDTGRLHTSFNQTVAATGRLSSSNPNLQNIPIRTELGREIRRSFVAGPGARLISLDYSQVELRIMAHISGDERLIEYFRRGVDVHRETAASLYDVTAAEVTPEQRAAAKTVNFGIMYGQGAVGLARQIGVTREEAARFIDAYRARFPGVDRFLESTIADGIRNGYVTTLLNRRRYLPNLRSNHGRFRSEAERMAVNTPIQGTAADLIKVAMVRVHRELAATFPRARLLLQVHDELLLEAPAEEADAVAARVRTIMETAMDLTVPVVVDTGVGADWFSIH